MLEHLHDVGSVWGDSAERARDTVLRVAGQVNETRADRCPLNPPERDRVKTLTRGETCVTRAANRGDQDPPDVLLRQKATAPPRSGDESRAFRARAA